MAVWLAKLTQGFTIPFNFDTYLACETSVPVRTAFYTFWLTQIAETSRGA